jgi:hypothetical protein
MRPNDLAEYDADLNERDHAALQLAVEDGVVSAEKRLSGRNPTHVGEDIEELVVLDRLGRNDQDGPARVLRDVRERGCASAAPAPLQPAGPV